MTILSDGEIVEELAEGDLGIAGYADLDVQIQPSTLDLRLGDSFLRYKGVVREVDPVEHDHADLMEEHTDAEKIHVHPDDFILGTTIESVNLPDDIQGEVTGRSSYGRFGIEVHSTAGLIDPGWSGQITLEISNNTKKTITLTPGERICQMTFERMGRPAERPYGTRDHSKYDGQDGPTAARRGGEVDG